MFNRVVSSIKGEMDVLFNIENIVERNFFAFKTITVALKYDNSKIELGTFCFHIFI